MISDVLSDAEAQIKEYLAWDNCPYDPRGTLLRERIERLLIDMQTIRHTVGMDIPPCKEFEYTDKQADNWYETSGVEVREEIDREVNAFAKQYPGLVRGTFQRELVKDRMFRKQHLVVRK